MGWKKSSTGNKQMRTEEITKKIQKMRKKRRKTLVLTEQQTKRHNETLRDRSEANIVKQQMMNRI